MNPTDSVFRAYDIRGLYPTEINEEFAFSLGQSFARFIIKETGQTVPTIAVGYDMRISSPSLKDEVINGLIDQGVNVIDIGMVSTPTFYFAVANYGYDAGIQVSASHNPAEYNGFKMVRAGAVPVSGETGIVELKEMMMQNKVQSSNVQVPSSKREGVIKDHVAYELNYAKTEGIKPFKIVVDTANGMGGPLFREFFKSLPCELVELYFEPDGTFPNHGGDPLKDENMRDLQAAVIREKADLGIALDGDADRIFFVDNLGKTIEPAIIRGWLSKIFLKEYPGATICYDVRPGRITEDLILENGGVPVVTRVGHSLIKEKSREVNAVFAGESSGHFFVKLPIGIFETPMIVTLKILQDLSASGQTMAEYIKPWQRYFHSGEINFVVADKQAVFDRLKEKYSQNLKYDFDGLSFEWPDYWFNVRASNTGNLTRLNLEARDAELMAEKRDEVLSLIRE